MVKTLPKKLQRFLNWCLRRLDFSQNAETYKDYLESKKFTAFL